MSDELVLQPILARTFHHRGGTPGPGPDAQGRALVLGSLTDAGWSAVGDSLAASSAGTLAIAPASGCAAASVIARFRCHGSSGKDAALILVPASRGVFASGRPVLGLKVLRPGTAISLPTCGEFLLVRRHRASPCPVPPRLAEKACGVCGMPLKLSLVAACSCGTWYHSEGGVAVDPTLAPDEEKKLLCCFTNTRICLNCKREKTFEPVLLPEPESLGFRRSS